MRLALLIPLVVCGIDFGNLDVAQGCDWLGRRPIRFCLRPKRCCTRFLSHTPLPTTHDPDTCVLNPTVRPSAEVEQRKEPDDAARFAAIANTIKQSKTVTWTVTPYTRWTSKDGKRTWLEVGNRSEMAYQAPNLFRDTRYDNKGNVFLVQIVDASQNQMLQLVMKPKKAMRMHEPINVYGSGHPLAMLANRLKDEPPKFVERREIHGSAVDVYRYIRQPRRTSLDIWLDAKTKRLVGISDPGGDQLDPATGLERDNAPGRNERGRGRIAGHVRSVIVLDAPLRPDLFSLEPPDGFEVVDAPPRPNANAVQ